jgi:hypothetical protein
LVISKINNNVWRQVWNPTSIMGTCAALEHLRIPEIQDNYAYFVAIMMYDGQECVLIDPGSILQAFAEAIAEVGPTELLNSGLTLGELNN